MIVEPDFFDHWRTRMVVDALDGDECAPIYIQRLWAHCEKLRTVSFEIPCEGLKFLCRYTGDSRKLESSLIDAKFMRRDGNIVTVYSFEENNARIIRSWNSTQRQLDVPAREWEELRMSVFSRDGYRCVYCGCSTDSPECDHIHPVSKGGKSVLENLATACRPCNRSKGAKTLDEWRAC